MREKTKKPVLDADLKAKQIGKSTTVFLNTAK